MFDKIVLIGYSGHGLVVTDAALKAGMSLKFYADRHPIVENPFNLSYLGFEGDEKFTGWNSDYKFVLGVGDNNVRKAITLRISEHNGQMINVIHPDSSISDMVNMGFGNFVSRRVAINPLVEIGNYCILNTGCIVEHECKIGDGVHIAPGAVLAGNVEVGNLTFVGANSVIRQGVKIGSNVIIGAGSVILKNVEDNQKVVGNPGRIIS